MDNHLGLAEVRRAHQKDKEMTEQEVATLVAQRREMRISGAGLETLRRALEGYLSLLGRPQSLREEADLALTYRLLVRIRQRLASPRREYRLGLSPEEAMTLAPVLLMLTSEQMGVYEQTVGSSVFMQLGISN